MRKTFPLQVWQTAGLILGTPPSHATRNLHSDNFTASHNVNTADDVLFTRHRLQDSGHPFSHGLPQQVALLHPVNPMRPTFAPGRPGQAAQQKPVDTRSSDAPIGGTVRPGCPARRQPMHQKNQRIRSNSSIFIQMRHSCTFVPLLDTCDGPASCIGYGACISIGGSTHKVALYTKNDNKS